ncbi:MAG: class IIb bacteriocin, lactobin A/cerein 7B family [Treponema sp.]|nr:class IIb bacteriocin, lactobin A/cerein 7B family [Treponema sp.]
MDLKSAYSDYDFYTKQVEAAEKQAKNKSADSQQNGKALELTDAELEMVAGGAGNWLEKNWKTIVIVAAIAAAMFSFATTE